MTNYIPKYLLVPIEPAKAKGVERIDLAKWGVALMKQIEISNCRLLLANWHNIPDNQEPLPKCGNQPQLATNEMATMSAPALPIPVATGSGMATDSDTVTIPLEYFEANSLEEINNIITAEPETTP